jgi:hypothetical protein
LVNHLENHINLRVSILEREILEDKALSSTEFLTNICRSKRLWKSSASSRIPACLSGNGSISVKILVALVILLSLRDSLSSEHCFRKPIKEKEKAAEGEIKIFKLALINLFIFTADFNKAVGESIKFGQ